MATLNPAAGRSRSSDEAMEQALLRPWPRLSLKLILLVLGIVAAFVWSLEGTNASPRELVAGIPNIWDFITRMFPPRFETETETLQTPAIPLPFGITIPRIGLAGVTFPYPTIISAIVETLQMAIIGTALAILFSAPFAILAARNLTHPVVYSITRFLLNVNRAVPDIIFALILVAAIGLGPFAGVLALGIGSIGFMAKVYAESIEAIDPQQVLAVRATGAGRMQTIVYAVAPQAMPMIASYSILLFETNVRAATILGIVGAGGVGFELNKYLALFQYQLLMGAMIIIILVITVIDRLSDRMRRRIT